MERTDKYLARRRERAKRLVTTGRITRQLPAMAFRNPLGVAKWLELALLGRFASARCLNYPPLLQIETTNLCNLRCRMCPREKEFEKLEIKPSTMSFETFEAIVGSWISHIYQIHLFGRGEPLMARELPEMIHYAAQHGVPYITFNTNGHLLKGETAERLAASELDELRVSIDGSDDDAYQAVRGVPLQRLKENLLAFRELCDIPISIATTLAGDNWESVTGIADLAQEIGASAVRLFPVAPYTDLGVEDTGLSAHQKKDYKGFCEDLKKRCAAKGVNFMSISHYAPSCNVPFVMAFIDVEGNLTVCCRLETMTVGNVLESDFAEVWRGEKMFKWRKRLLSKDFPKPCTDLECIHDWR